MNKKIVWQSLVNALATFVYTALVSWFMFSAENFFGKEDKFTAPLFILTLLIISATVTGFFVLGRPVQLYTDNRKKEAVGMLFITIGWLVLFALITVLTLLK